MRRLTICLAALSVVAVSGVCFAEKAATLKPALVKPGKAVLEESFSASELAEPWSVVKGTWQVADGVLVASEKKEDAHAGVLVCQAPHRDSAIQFSFQLAGADALHLSLNRAKGHLFRVIITPDGVVVNKDKDKKNPASKAEVLGRGKAEFAPGTWHTMLVEMQGEQVVVQTDGGVLIKATSAALAADKPNYRFIIRGSSARLDDVKISAVAN